MKAVGGWSWAIITSSESELSIWYASVAFTWTWYLPGVEAVNEQIAGVCCEGSLWPKGCCHRAGWPSTCRSGVGHRRRRDRWTPVAEKVSLLNRGRIASVDKGLVRSMLATGGRFRHIEHARSRGRGAIAIRDPHHDADRGKILGRVATPVVAGLACAAYRRAGCRVVAVPVRSQVPGDIQRSGGLVGSCTFAVRVTAWRYSGWAGPVICTVGGMLMGPVSRRQFVEPPARRVSRKEAGPMPSHGQRYHSPVLATNRPTRLPRGGGTAEPYSESFVKVAGSGCRGSGVCDADTPSQRWPPYLCAGSLGTREDEGAILLRHSALDLGTGGNSISPTRSLGPPLLRAQKILCRPGATSW